MNVEHIFSEWRKNHSAEHSWALAWYLANELCKRFYASHGIAPWIIDHSGLGYYGISLNKLECGVNGRNNKPLGRLTMGGDVENWITGGPGDHGLQAIKMCDDGVALSALVGEAIHYLRLPAHPEKTHLSCRHKRWGASYELCFEMATILALKYENQIELTNNPEHTAREIASMDDRASMREHPGAFYFSSSHGSVLIAGDGRVLDHSGDNIWDRYMQGQSAHSLANHIAEIIGIRPNSNDAYRVILFLEKLYPTEPVEYSNMSALGPHEDGSYSFPTISYDTDVESFYEEISADRWTDTQYVPEAVAEQIEQPGYIENADLDQIRTLFTYCHRGEKFCDGHWGSMIEKGHIKRLLLRLQQLYESW